VPIQMGLHVYAHCQRGVSGGVTLLVINNDRSAERTLVLPDVLERYTLDAATLQDVAARLNGNVLALDDAGELPRLSGISMAPGPMVLAPATITFLAIPGAGNSACR
jgi:heparanase